MKPTVKRAQELRDKIRAEIDGLYLNASNEFNFIQSAKQGGSESTADELDNEYLTALAKKRQEFVDVYTRVCLTLEAAARLLRTFGDTAPVNTLAHEGQKLLNDVNDEVYPLEEIPLPKLLEGSALQITRVENGRYRWHWNTLTPQWGEEDTESMALRKAIASITQIVDDYIQYPSD